jgi:hypothetical protein
MKKWDQEAMQYAMLLPDRPRRESRLLAIEQNRAHANRRPERLAAEG